MKEVNFKIVGMHCNGCVASVKEELSNISGIKSFDVSLEKGQCSVIFEQEDKSQDVLDAISFAGFDGSIIG